MSPKSKKSAPLGTQAMAIAVERLNSEGQGVGSLGGLACFVDGALPGETVRGRVVTQKRNYARLAADTIENPSPERVDPECPYYSACGGCQVMHMNYPAQLAFKTRKVREALERIGKLESPAVADCLPAPSPQRYRNKLQFNVRAGKNGAEIGFFARASHRVVPIADCLVHSALGQKVYRTILELVGSHAIAPYDENADSGFLRHVLLRSSEATHEALVVFVTRSAGGKDAEALAALAAELMRRHPEVIGVLQNVNEVYGNTILGKKTRTLAGRDYLRERLLGLEFHVSARSFFQVNTAQAERLFRAAIETAGLTGSERVLDAYSGTGVLGIAIAASSGSVVGIETVPEAVADARANAERNGITNAEFLLGDAENLFAQAGKVDVAFLDPPRKGCEEKFLAGLASLGPRRIVYISCDPATLARDLHFLGARGYALERALPVDMFPQTSHVECIAVLKRDRIVSSPN